MVMARKCADGLQIDAWCIDDEKNDICLSMALFSNKNQKVEYMVSIKTDFVNSAHPSFPCPFLGRQKSSIQNFKEMPNSHRAFAAHFFFATPIKILNAMTYPFQSTIRDSQFERFGVCGFRLAVRITYTFRITSTPKLVLKLKY